MKNYYKVSLVIRNILCKGCDMIETLEAFNA